MPRMSFESLDPAYPLLAAMAMSLILLQLNQRLASPILSIINRWIRWFVFSFGTGYILLEFDVFNRPYWVLVLMCFFVWFLLETLYNWLAISALSQSPMPIFPGYSVNPGGDEWPAQKRMTAIRDWLRQEGYRPIQALRAEIAASIYLRVSVYEHPVTKLRLQLMFMPQPSGTISMAVIATTLLADDRRIVTDNLHIPFGGFYPENWHVERRPWTRSLKALVGRHERRLKRLQAMPVSIRQLPLVDIEQTQHELDRLNIELGFLLPHHEREEFGKISQEGRYRVWKEIWMLDYLGRSARYQ